MTAVWLLVGESVALESYASTLRLCSGLAPASVNLSGQRCRGVQQDALQQGRGPSVLVSVSSRPAAFPTGLSPVPRPRGGRQRPQSESSPKRSAATSMDRAVGHRHAPPFVALRAVARHVRSTRRSYEQFSPTRSAGRSRCSS